MAPAIASLMDAPLAPNRPSPERSIGFASLRPQLDAMSALVAAMSAMQEANTSINTKGLLYCESRDAAFL